jgi:hypothetical protein
VDSGLTTVLQIRDKDGNWVDFNTLEEKEKEFLLEEARIAEQFLDAEISIANLETALESGLIRKSKLVEN